MQIEQLNGPSRPSPGLDDYLYWQECAIGRIEFVWIDQHDFELTDQWTPPGDVLRCVVADGGPDAQATVHIDDREFSLSEFGRILTTYAGWGMRITFVPEEDLEREPTVELREPD